MFLDERVALVTGGSRGIGRAVALALADAGARVIINYAGNLTAANAVVEQITTCGGEALAIQADVALAAQVDEMMQQALTRFERLDILVNNAGIARDNLIVRMKEEEWDQVLDTNLKGVYLCSKAVARPMMKQRYGRIINISSVVGRIGNAGQVNYAAAKAGIFGITKSLAKELGSRNITVNAIAPGYIATDMTAGLSETVKEELQRQIPLQRLGNPEDIAAAVVFLASEAAGYISGQTLGVDGGMAMC